MPMFDAKQAAEVAPSNASAYQEAILPKVSRTFALTIPQLPPALRDVVANAYLLCRIADTIEDEPAFTAEEKGRYENAFVSAVTGHVDARGFAADIAPRLSSATSESERDLVFRLPLVLEVTDTFNPTQHEAIVECLRVMSQGMHDFQRVVGPQGLETLRDMDRYCYHVAGVVGEMLTKLLIDFEPELVPQTRTLMRLAISFGQGLQMTNILKDQWEDRSHGVCWLPRDVFARHGVELRDLTAGQQDARYANAMIELIGVAHSHLCRAVEYTLLVPARHAGFRRFCLWSIGLAVLTLRNLQDRLDFSSGTEVKVSRAAVAQTIGLTRLSDKYDPAVRFLFGAAARKLPLTPLGPEWDVPQARNVAWPWRRASDFKNARSL
ncbi:MULTISPECIES: phytoene/squalene synthase family protein [unclassified Dyella]|uniref:phytoene/squalene synthase family protein n=1 Tax=unclassified Dyella TaxID=2634549 RepID=UPI000CBF1E9C|nr:MULTISPECIES: phytoene/squalene synthase family protein [unclassified Dyella]MDR3443845.1 phytoene/squalene synthase family protein [Dyella sp.]PMQ03092.1 All-trans-phytoene synthase [Dyella sp. AD56]